MEPEEGSWKTWNMKKAEAVSTHSDFPDGINVELVQVYSETGMKIRVWERGSKETLSCEAEPVPRQRRPSGAEEQNRK